MSGGYNPDKIEPKWQKFWERSKLYEAQSFSKKPKCYILIEFPYPSGVRLHVGHGRSYCAFDALSRMKRMQGFNVLYPFGWDAFGLPAENYAIRTGIHPSVTTKENIANAKEQAQSWGLSFDWSREVDTTDPGYYRWTQWIFLQLFKKGLAYRGKMPVNWCPACKINLANEEVVQGKCERCGAEVKRREQEQWMLKITAYADRLVDDLDSVDYRTDIKQQQINWIGRSSGAKIRFPIPIKRHGGSKSSGSLQESAAVEVFTTRPDTLFGVTFLVLSPEKTRDYLELMPSGERKAVERYIKSALKKSELQRQGEKKEKTGVFTGIYAQHPITGENISLWVADFVLPDYGTGAIMAVPAHDQRDFEFAKKFKLPIKEVIENKAESKFPKEAFTGEGELINSGKFTGSQSEEASDKIGAWLKKNRLGGPAIDYKLRDWVFSRQHYWGEPIPLVFCERCAAKIAGRSYKSEAKGISEGERLNPGWIPVPEKDLPVELPYLEKYEPAGTGESPLAAAKEWLNVKCPRCGGPARRETDTMPNWAGSSWYFLRYVDPDNRKQFAAKNKLAYWMPVDWYNGGMEHTTLHLLYSRFWHKFLYDLGLVPNPEPYARRTSHGVVLGPDGHKMSKSKGNVINPDDVVSEFGADTFRVYEMFMGPFEQRIAWDPQGVVGVHRFLDRIWRVNQKIVDQSTSKSDKNLERALNRLVKQVGEGIAALKFNTAVAAMMEFINGVMSGEYRLAKKDWQTFLKILAPFAPHLAEELWVALSGAKTLKAEASVHAQVWPEFDPKLLAEETVTVIVQVNGRLRGKVDIARGTGEATVLKLAEDTASDHLSGREVIKTIFVPDKLVNFVI